MAQFDVYKNPSKQTREYFPYLLDIQNPLLEDIATRIVVPLGLPKGFLSQGMKNLTPEMEYKGQSLILAVPQIASISKSVLSVVDGSLADCRDVVIAALDFAIVGI